jgi:hypothetical protein
MKDWPKDEYLTVDAQTISGMMPDWVGELEFMVDGYAWQTRPITLSGVKHHPFFGLELKAWFRDGDSQPLPPRTAIITTTGVKVTEKPENVVWGFVPMPYTGLGITLDASADNMCATAIPGVPGRVQVYTGNHLGLCDFGREPSPVMRCGLANYTRDTTFDIPFGMRLGYLFCAPCHCGSRATSHFLYELRNAAGTAIPPEGGSGGEGAGS